MRGIGISTTTRFSFDVLYRVSTIQPNSTHLYIHFPFELWLEPEPSTCAQLDIEEIPSPTEPSRPCNPVGVIHTVPLRDLNGLTGLTINIKYMCKQMILVYVAIQWLHDMTGGYEKVASTYKSTVVCQWHHRDP